MAIKTSMRQRFRGGDGWTSIAGSDIANLLGPVVDSFFRGHFLFGSRRHEGIDELSEKVLGEVVLAVAKSRGQFVCRHVERAEDYVQNRKRRREVLPLSLFFQRVV